MRQKIRLAKDDAEIEPRDFISRKNCRGKEFGARLGKVTAGDLYRFRVTCHFEAATSSHEV
jgi:hypothetical protein